MHLPSTHQPGTPAQGEQELLAQLRSGQEAAFAQVIRQHGGRLLAVARRLLGNEEDAQDAVQDAFLSAFKALDQFDGRAQFATWLHRIVVNSALQKLRRQQRQETRSIDEWLPHYLNDGHQADPAQEWRPGPATALERQETRRLVREAIDLLPEAYRMVLLLRDLEEVNTEETAQLLGITVGMVKTRLHRARQALRSLLDPHFRRESL